MGLATYQTVDEFLARAQPFLEVNEALNNMILGVLFRMRAHPERIEAPPYLVTVEDERGVALAGMMTSPYNIVLSSDRSEPGPFCEIVANDLLSNNWSPPGVFGLSALSKTFADVWAGMTERPYRDGMRQRAFELREVVRYGSERRADYARLRREIWNW